MNACMSSCLNACSYSAHDSDRSGRAIATGVLVGIAVFIYSLGEYSVGACIEYQLHYKIIGDKKVKSLRD